MATTDAPLVRLTAVTRVFDPGGARVRALDGVDLEVRAGEWIVVLGPSGCGKTTLLNVISALDTPTSGRAVVLGTDVGVASRAELFRLRRHGVSLVFQTFNLFPGLTAEENVRLAADLSGRDEPGRAAADALERVGLAGRARHFPHELSGGEQQRVAIARAVAGGNPLLLADEPTGELDFRTGVQILALLHEQHHQPGRAVVVVTHNREIARVADRVVEMGSGRVVSDGPPDGGRVEIADLRW